MGVVGRWSTGTGVKGRLSGGSCCWGGVSDFMERTLGFGAGGLAFRLLSPVASWLGLRVTGLGLVGGVRFETPLETSYLFPVLGLTFS